MQATTTWPTANSANHLDQASGPKIFSQLQASAEQLEEGDPLQFVIEISCECDCTVDWFKDGKPITAGSRLNTNLERGLATLDILYGYPEDSGSYFCVASNRHGTVQSNALSITILAEVVPVCDDSAMINEQFASNAYASPEDNRRNGPSQEPPKFLKDVSCSDPSVLEGQGTRFEAVINIISDGTLVVDWFKNDKPIANGSRINCLCDRGYLALEIGYCLKDDSGMYTCLVKNSLGQVQSSKAAFECVPEASVVTNSILHEDSIKTLKALDDPGEEFGDLKVKTEPPRPPSFKGPITPASMDCTEGETVVFSVQVDQGFGNNLLESDWLKDDKLVKFGSRITGSLEMGLAQLKIGSMHPDDSGVYTCLIKTEHGTVQSEPARLACSAVGSIIAASQLPGDKVKGLQAIETLEAALNAQKVHETDEEEHKTAPSIVKEPVPVGELEDGSPVHFEAVVEPASDPNLRVEWFKDDKPLASGTRFRVDYDRGMATLDILYTIQEDSGHYWLVVSNLNGQIASTKIDIACHGKAEVITQSNLLQGSDGYKLIQSIEDVGGEYAYRFEEPEQAPSPPKFDTEPQALVTMEGDTAKFYVKIGGYPVPEVHWTVNGEPVKEDSITKVTNDGGISYLEFSRCCFDKGCYQIGVLAENINGQVDASTVLTVQGAEDFRPDLKHIKPENPFKKMLGLKKVDLSEELNKALHKAKPSPQSLLTFERDSEFKARHFKSPEVMQAENLLDKVAVNLRKSEFKRASQPMNNGVHVE